MTDKERLVELLKEIYPKTRYIPMEECREKIADAIIADGWIRPPCKVGDTVCFVARNSGEPIGIIDEVEIVMIGKTESGWCAKGKLCENTFDIPKFEIDNYAFYASREEAEKALWGGGKS